MAVTVTVNTNSYVSVVDCTAYLADRLYTAAYTAASADEKSQAVIMATRKIDRLLLGGRKYVDTQALAFPRCYTVDPRAPYTYNQTIPLTWSDGWYCETEAPQAVIDATCEEALAILTNGDPADRLKMQRQGVTSFTLGNLSETYGNVAGTAAVATKGLLSPEAAELLRPYRGGSVFIS